MLFSCWITNATDIHSEYVIIIAPNRGNDVYVNAAFYVRGFATFGEKMFVMLIILQSFILDLNISLALTMYQVKQGFR
jgi:hypothetical protein